MTDTRFDVAGIGNAIVDIIARCDDDFIDAQGLTKGTMRLIDAAEADRLYGLMGPATEMSGGSAANTCAGLASLGARTAFIGKVAGDQFGTIFQHDIRSIGVAYETPQSESKAPTARCLVLVTPDGERTMCTYLGASTELGNGEIVPEVIRSARITYLEGYLFDPPEAKAAFHEAARIAAEAGRQVALSLSDTFCVERHRAAFRSLIQGGVDILFGNQEEVCALYETDTLDDALSALRAECTLAAVTRSGDGSIIMTQEDTIEIPAVKVDELVDTTGAGDLYAAGFLHGLARGRPLQECGQLASLTAGEIVSHIGARPETPLAELARGNGL
ncbi:MAG: adenosine kinase, partial [Dichotomicrobium sp.]